MEIILFEHSCESTYPNTHGFFLPAVLLVAVLTDPQ